jgi:hypothetical protein
MQGGVVFSFYYIVIVDRYYLVAKKSLWEIKIFVFARNNLRIGQEISGVETSSVATGIMGIMGNKGGVAVAMRLHTLSLCFVNSHLAAHTEKNADRHRMFEEIDSGLKVGNNELDMSMQFDHLFWIGDLNYRIELPPEQIVTYIEDRKWTELFLKDQLLQGMIKQESFSGYSEGVIDFAPTYKFKMPKGHGRKRSRTVKKPIKQKDNSDGKEDALAAVDEDDEDSDNGGDDSFKAGTPVVVMHPKKKPIPPPPSSDTNDSSSSSSTSTSTTSAISTGTPSNSTNGNSQTTSTASSTSSTTTITTTSDDGIRRVTINRVKPPIPTKPPTAISVAHASSRMSRAVRPGQVKQLVNVYAAKDAAAANGAIIPKDNQLMNIDDIGEFGIAPPSTGRRSAISVRPEFIEEQEAEKLTK